MTEGAPKSRSRVFIILIVAALILAGVAIGAWTYFSGQESTEDAQVDGHIPPVGHELGTWSAVHRHNYGVSSLRVACRF